MPEPKGYLRAQDGAFDLHAARRVAPNDRQGREMLCRYILRPPGTFGPLANERLHLMEDGMVTLEFKQAVPEPGTGPCGRYIPWHELLRRTFGSEVVCPDCGGKRFSLARKLS